MDPKKLIEALEAAGISQLVIAQKCGISQGYVSQLKNGKRKRISHTVGEALKTFHAEILPADATPCTPIKPPSSVRLRKRVDTVVRR
jgi:transcriptional regulator with XRE-family HTH domain